MIFLLLIFGFLCQSLYFLNQITEKYSTYSDVLRWCSLHDDEDDYDELHAFCKENLFKKLQLTDSGGWGCGTGVEGVSCVGGILAECDF